MGAESTAKLTGLEVAVIGMAGRFPGAGNIEEFWENLIHSRDTTTFFSDEQLRAAGIEPGLIEHPDYVKARPVLEGKEYFDTAFFGYSPAEAEVMAPHIRLFYECTWTALEDAGYDPFQYGGLIGCYVGAASSFAWQAFAFISGKHRNLGAWATPLFSEKDFLSTRLAYKLNLRGPCLTVNTACSTSLVAVHLGCRALLTGECGLALAGGISLDTTGKPGYLYQEGMIHSADGHCRTFDAKTSGTVFGEGVGLVVLKRCQEAIEDGDHIYALIKGSAVNNDGVGRVGFTAPGLEGQRDVVQLALKAARVEAESITYVETHGTATLLGDPVEIEALHQAFHTDKKHFCALGSVKSNVGHLEAAAGVASLIKTVLMLKYRRLPPTLHFESPNPGIDFENSPFFVNTELKEWRSDGHPLRAGVSSFGIGGTNAHVVVEEAPPVEGTAESSGREYKLLLLSARTLPALDLASKNLAAYCRRHPGIDLSDAAYTLQRGRRVFRHRRLAVCSSPAEAADLLAAVDSPKVKTFSAEAENQQPAVVFMFPGLGAEYVDMGRELYEKEPLFAREMDRCFAILDGLLDYHIKEILYPPRQGRPPKEQIGTAEIAQLVLFTIEYALATLLMHWGIRPSAMIGYSFGEYVAAAAAGVFSLPQALKLLVARGELIAETDMGGMLSVPLSKEELLPRLPAQLSLAIDNDSSCVVSGQKQALEQFAAMMREQKIMCMPLAASRALHSVAMEPILAAFEERVREVERHTPRIPYISNVTGTWIGADQALEPAYWSSHLRHTVRFADGIRLLIDRWPETVFLEVGPGRDLSALVMRYLDNRPRQRAIQLIRPGHKEISDLYFLLNRLGRLWLYGVRPDWQRFYSGEPRRRLPLPTYPFERQSFPAEGDPFAIGQGLFGSHSSLYRRQPLTEWFYMPSWKRVREPNPRAEESQDRGCFLVFADDCGLAAGLMKKLARPGHLVIKVTAGAEFSRQAEHHFVVNPSRQQDYDTLLAEVERGGQVPARVVHLWSVTAADRRELDSERADRALDLGYFSLLHLARAVGSRGWREPVHLTVVSSHMQEVKGGEVLEPEKATLLGPVRVIPLEYRNLECRSIDIELPGRDKSAWARLSDQLYAELTAEAAEPVVAYRDFRRWLPIFEPLTLAESGSRAIRLKERGVYWIVGGLGGIGLILAEYLARTVSCRLILTGRSGLPERRRWRHCLGDGAVDDRLKEKIRRVQALEALGAEVLVAAADVGDESRLREVAAEARNRFGAVHGLVHCAGIADGEMIQRRDRAASARIFAAKIGGTLILYRLLRELGADFLILNSSMSAHLPQLGQVGYCAANVFLNAFAGYANGIGGPPVVAVDWDRWQNIGVALIAEARHRELTGGELEGGITAAEGAEAFGRILSDPLPQVVVSTHHLEAVIENYASLSASSPWQGAERVSPSRSLGRRPELDSEYAAPRSGLEETLCRIWADFFGFHEVGIHDDFFELGGDSLKAMMVASRIHRALAVEIPLPEFFNRATVAQLASYFAGAGRESYAAIPAAEAREYYPLSSAQERLFILQQLAGDFVGYNETSAILLEGEVDKERVARTFRELIARHDSLRTSFELVHDEPVQRILDQVDFDIEYDDSGSRPQVSDFIRPFDLSRAPLFRVGLMAAAEGKHILVVDIHHIIADGTSMRIFTRDFFCLYRRELLPTLRIQYKDFCQWQQAARQRETVGRQQAYWLREFSGEIPVLNLPADFPRPPVQSFAGRSLNFELPGPKTAALKELAKKEGATLVMVLLAVTNIFLAKLSGQQDIVVGLPIAGRSHQDLEALMGMFVNTLALRSHPRGASTCLEFLRGVKARTLEALGRQEYPFEDLVDKLGERINRDVSRNPLFDVMFVFQNLAVSLAAQEGQGESGLQPASFAFENRISRFDLVLDGAEAGDRLLFKMSYCTALFARETVERFIQYFRRIVSSFIENPGGKIADIELLTDGEKRRIAADFNRTHAAYPGQRTVCQLFADQVQRSPHGVALIDTGLNRFVSYGEFNRQATRLAGQLQARGAAANAVVAIMAGRSLAMMIGIFGILKAGGAYLPIDPGCPDERLRFMLADSEASLVLTDLEHRRQDRLPEAVDVLALLGDGDNITDPAPLTAGYPSPAYVIYTSGTTGRPKGAVIDHHSLVNRLHWMQKKYPLGRLDTLLQKTSYTFDVSVWEIFWWSFTGARLCLLLPGAEKDPGIMADTIARCRVTVLHFVPSMLHVFLAYLEDRGGVEKLSGLRQVIASGEALSSSLVGRFYRLLFRRNSSQLANLYGPTEATIDVSYYDCSPGEQPDTIPIGKPIDNIALYVLNREGQIQPIGFQGELCIAGVGLARGYLNNPELTAEKFMNLAAKGREDTRSSKHQPLTPKSYILYRTGDLARFLPDGNLEFLGRLDHQVKIRGFRIELAEVENRLLQHEAITGAVVVSRNGGGDHYLCAYITTDQTNPTSQTNKTSPTELRQYLAASLPDYMIPAYFVNLHQLPLTANGKVDRRALPEPQFQPGDNYTAPANETEEKLAAIWADVLGIEKAAIGTNHNFFEMGGHSLRAFILVSKIHRELGVKVPLTRIFKTPTIAGLGAFIKEARHTAYASVWPVEQKEYYTLSAAQKRLYMLQQMEPETVAYNMPNVAVLEGQVERSKMAGVFGQLIARHESLRTSFTPLDKQIVQRVCTGVDFEIDYHDLTEAGGAGRRPEQIVRAFIRPFDLGRAPLLRVGLIHTPSLRDTPLERGHTPSRGYVLVIDTHHIVSDGTSQSLFIEEFIALYAGETLPAVTIQYKDYSEWQNSPAARESWQRQADYWLQEFAGDIPVLNLPADFKRPKQQGFAGHSLLFNIEAEESALLKRVALEEEVSLFVVLLAVLNILVSRLTGQQDILVGTQVAGRGQAELRRTQGVFINTLVLRNYPHPQKTFREFVREMMARTMAAFENQDYQFEDLAEKLLGKREAGRNPLFDVMFVWQNMELPELEIPGLKLRPYQGELNGKALIDLSLYGYEAAGRLSFLFEYSTELFKEETIQRFIAYFKQIISLVTVDRDIQLKDITIAHHLARAQSNFPHHQDPDFAF